MREKEQFREKVVFFAHAVVALLGALACAYLIVRYLLAAVLPFFLSWGLSMLCSPLARRIGRGRAERALRLLLVVSFLLAGLIGFGFLTGKLVAEATAFLARLAGNGEIDAILGRLLRPFGGAAGAGGKIGEAVGAVAEAALAEAGGAVADFAARIPRRVFFAVMLLISSIYFSWDLERVNRALLSVLPERAQKALRDYRASTLRVVLRYIRSYAFLMLITFGVVLTGLLILRVRYALLLAALIALLDALPVIGVGTVIVPWSVYAFVAGERGLAVGLLVLLAVNELLRQFLEPKILGKNLGIHPLLTLVLLYAGYCTLGVGGLVLVPLFAVLIAPLVRRKAASPDGA